MKQTFEEFLAWRSISIINNEIFYHTDMMGGMDNKKGMYYRYNEYLINNNFIDITEFQELNKNNPY